MKITETIHAFRHSFRLALGEGRYADRFVYSYLLLGEKVCLIDTGVSATVPLLLSDLKQIGRTPQEISTVILTHAHPDHIGGNINTEGKPVYPNARWVIWRDEWQFWISDQSEKQLAERQKHKAEYCAAIHICGFCRKIS